jgi:acetyl-CoA C-acetyltransferase
MRIHLLKASGLIYAKFLIDGNGQFMNSDIVIVSAARTPMGAFQGNLSTVNAPDLGANVIRAVIEGSGVDKEYIDEVLMGNVLSAGIGQAPARQAALNAGLSQATSCVTISKVCGSGMKSVMLACDQIKAGSIQVAIAGGMENMSLAPYFIPKARGGLRLGHGEIVDHMFYDGLQNAYDGQLMGCFADANSKADNITREQMDEYAVESLKRAQNAVNKGYFDAEISAVTIQTRKGDITVDADESPQTAKPEKIPTLRPAFGKEGLVTAANASSISDDVCRKS